MGALSTRPITIEEFDKLNLPPNRKWELHNGEIVEMSLPSLIHKLLEERISTLFKQAFPGHVVLDELPFKIGASNDERGADVGVSTKKRVRESLQTRILTGAPELVVEVLSPSSNVLDLKKYRRLCFDNGTEIFLTVDPEDNTIEIQRSSDKQGTLLNLDETLELSLLGMQVSIPVRAIFSGITLPETDQD